MILSIICRSCANDVRVARQHLFRIAAAAYVGLSMVVSLLCTLLVFPAVIIARRFYWALPFATLAFKSEHPRLKALAKWTFELCLSLNTITRLLTIPLRPLPDFYIGMDIYNFPYLPIHAIISRIHSFDSSTTRGILLALLHPDLHFIAQGCEKWAHFHLPHHSMHAGSSNSDHYMRNN